MNTDTPPLFQGAVSLCELLQHRRMQLAVAESCTGGLIGAAITMVAGSSAVFAGGVIAYSNPVKQELLGVPAELLQTHGAVSAAVVEAMARGVQRLMKVHCALSVSGIAGPGGGSEHKPVGLVYIGMALGDELLSFEHYFAGDRQAVREQAALVAMECLRDALQKM